MLQDILLAIWFMLPAALANAAPVFAAVMPFLKKYDAPIDGGKTFQGRPLFGPHKTWRGLVSGIIVATLVLWIQQILVVNYEWARFISDGVDYSSLPLLIAGPLFGLGALGADAIKSFFKRRRGIKSGGSWIPFDQIDYIVGSVLVSLLFVTLSLTQYIWIFIIWFVMHIAVSFIGYKLGLKKSPI